MSVRTIVLRTPQGKPSGAPPPPEPDTPHWEIVPIFGQSRAGGYGGRPAISTSPAAEGHVWMLQTSRNDGPRVMDFDTTQLMAPAAMSAVIPLREVDEPGAGTQFHGETFASGFAAALVARVPDIQALVLCCGQSGRSINAFMPPSNHYTNFLTAITRAVALNPTDLPPRVAAVLWSQGDSDQTNSNYQTQLAAWGAQMASDVKAITGQLEDPAMLISMEETNVVEASDAIPRPLIAKRALHGTDPRCRVVGVHYWMRYNSDETHLPAYSSRMYCQQLAWAWHRHTVLGESFDMIEPQSRWIDDGQLYIQFTGNSSALVLDAATISNPGNFGFVYVRSGVTVPLSGVTLVGPSTVRMSTSDTFSGGAIRYAIHNPLLSGIAQGSPPTARGCLRAADPIFTDVDTGENRYNWAIPFEIAVP